MGSTRTPTALQDTVPAATGDRSKATARVRRPTATLPAELIKGGAQRLSIAALACAGVFVTVFAFMQLQMDWKPTNMPVANGVAAACVGVSLAFFFIARSKLRPELILDLGLLYEVVGAFGISLAETLATYQPDGRVRGISWVCLWIALFPLIVPSTPGKTFVFAVLSAAMGPVALYAATLAGVPMPKWSVVVFLVTPNFTAAGLAFVLTRVIHQLGTDVRRAQEMGSYQLVELLGQGGMGEVWRARHRMLAQPAAIKLVSAEALGGTAGDADKVLKRFEREARATAMLNSLNTIQIYDYGRTEDGTLYYVMELLDGVDLETLIEDHGGVPPERAVFLLRQVCESLEEAHASGLVHRDIKPANIYVCRLGNRHDCVKVLDFGIVAIRDKLQKGQTRLTADDAITGTPAFMAPETVTGDHEPDHRVDIYAIGCLAYWLVTGELVFDADTPVKMLYGHVEKKPKPPSARLGVALPDGLDELILDCLQKDPKDRPKTARVIADRLDAIELDSAWTEKQAAEWWSDHRVVSRAPARSARKKHETIVKA